MLITSVKRSQGFFGPLSCQNVCRAVIFLTYTVLALAPVHTSAQEPANTAAIRIEQLLFGLQKPVGFISAPNQANRAYIVEQGGLVKLLVDGKIRRKPFLDIRHLVSSKPEQGLSTIAFPPSYPTDKRVFAYFTDRQGDSIIGTFLPTEDDYLDEESLSVVLKVVQPTTSHFGGHLAFGSDGYLYVGVNDGNTQDFPSGHAQNTQSMLGKLIRIDTSEPAPYKIPTDNPLPPSNKSLAEIWALGFRNPLKFSFDRATGQLFLGDIGLHSKEEINIVEKGKNYGWRVLEGSSCIKPPCDSTRFTPPIFEYSHEDGTRVTGGLVYRGRQIPLLQGRYVFGDYESGAIWILTQQDGSWRRDLLFKTNRHITSFGEDGEGEIYVTTLEGEVARIVPGETGILSPR